MCSDSGDAPFNFGNAVQLLSKRKFEMHPTFPAKEIISIFGLLKAISISFISQ
jgi:hypothetical protein